MITLAQRIEELRCERGLSRPALAAELKLPRTAVEKFETGRQTPSREQQAQLAAFFGVSLFYLRGESNDRTRQETWMDAGFAGEEPAPAPAPRRAPKPTPAPDAGEQGGTLLDSMIAGKKFQEALQRAVLEALRSPEGQNLLTQVIRKELARMK
ncbi:MAG: helix-turn-helix transcriptional regulator [Lawsonibacter sp.]|nr:helix-turn-helix transcriptional regulator [Lawsonibacter sp.]